MQIHKVKLKNNTWSDQELYLTFVNLSFWEIEETNLFNYTWKF